MGPSRSKALGQYMATAQEASEEPPTLRVGVIQKVVKAARAARRSRRRQGGWVLVVEGRSHRCGTKVALGSAASRTCSPTHLQQADGFMICKFPSGTEVGRGFRSHPRSPCNVKHHGYTSEGSLLFLAEARLANSKTENIDTWPTHGVSYVDKTYHRWMHA